MSRHQNICLPIVVWAFLLVLTDNSARAGGDNKESLAYTRASTEPRYERASMSHTAAGTDTADISTHDAGDEAIAGHGHEFHPNHLSLINGYAFNGKKSGYKLGVKYARLFGDYYGAGAYADYTFGNVDSTALGGAFVVRDLLGDAILWGGPGVKIDDHGHSKFLFRTALGYQFHLERVSLVPIIGYDFVAHTTDFWWAGLTVGIGF